jgi:hypothetical protein
MSLTINNTPLIDNLNVWAASIEALPNLDYSSLNYSNCDSGKCECTDEEAINQVAECFTKSVIDTKISEPYKTVVSILKNKPNFELIPHFDNDAMLGVIIINLVDSNTSTKFYTTANVEIGQAPVSISNGSMYLNNWDFKHGYINTSSVDRYIALCIIYKDTVEK